MLVAGIAIAEVIAQFDIGGNAVSEVDESIDDAPLQLRGSGEPYVFQDAKLDRHVPLDGQFVTRNGSGDPVKLGEHRLLVGGFNYGPVLRGNESNDGRERCGEADLEAIMSGDDATWKR